MTQRSLSILLLGMTLFGSVLFGQSEPPLTPSQARAEFEAKSLVRKIFAQLSAPSAATLRGGGGGSSGDEEYWRQRVETSLSSSEVLGHYAAQLDALGWRRGPSHHESDFALQLWTFRDPEEKSWRGILTVSHSAAEADRQNVMLQLIRLRERSVP
jgi:hypothetical protein